MCRNVPKEQSKTAQSMTLQCFASTVPLPASIRITQHPTHVHNGHWLNWGFRFAAQATQLS